MKEDYPLKGQTVEVKFQLEKEVADTLKQMADFSKFSEAEIINTAVKRFISTHSDFLPKNYKHK
jgi:hypothetical protein